MQATVAGHRSDLDARKEGLPWRPRFPAQVSAAEWGTRPGLLGT